MTWEPGLTRLRLGIGDPGDNRMADEELITALDSNQEIQLTVTGRKSGRRSAFPVWFVRDGDELDLVPVTGTDSNWYKNVLKEPAIRVVAGSAQLIAQGDSGHGSGPGQ